MRLGQPGALRWRAPFYYRPRCAGQGHSRSPSTPDRGRPRAERPMPSGRSVGQPPGNRRSLFGQPPDNAHIGRLAVPSLGPRERQIEDHRSTTAAVRLERNSLTLGRLPRRANPSACRQGRCPPTEPPGAGHPRPRPQLATTSSLCSPGSGRRPAPTAHPACGNELPATLTPTGPTGGARSVPGSWARDGPGLARRDRARPRPALPRRTPGRRMRRRRGR